MGRKKKNIENNCLNCRWKQEIEKTGFCPSIKKEIDLNNPVFDCKYFRKYEGLYYKVVKPF